MAKTAQVSVATVSHVLNGTRFVRDGTRDRVLQAVQDLGYVSNPLARSLRTGQSQTLGLIMSAVLNPYFNDVVTSIEQASMAAGFTLLIADHRDEHELELRSVMNLCDRRIDGLLLQPSELPERSLAYIKKSRVPTVFVDRTIEDVKAEKVDFVGTENFNATVTVVQHLIGHGHRRIGMVSGAVGSSTTSERIAGYTEALRLGDIAWDPDLVESGESDEAHAERAVHTLLGRSDPPTALFSGNNRMTIGVLRALRDRHLIPPDDIALAVFDDFPWADLFTPRLTCARQQTERIGTRSVELLLDRMKKPDEARRKVQYPCRFVRRNSCGCH